MSTLKVNNIEDAGAAKTEILGSPPFLHIEDQKPSGTDGGDFTSGAWRTRDLNTVVTNEIDGASLASNQVTLPAGTYEIESKAPGWRVNRHILRLQNVSDAVTVLCSQNAFVNISAGTLSLAHLKGRFTITSEKTFELQHRCKMTNNSNGMGINIGGSWTVDHETYTQVWIKKVG